MRAARALRARSFPGEPDIQILHRFFPDPEQARLREHSRLLAMMGLYFVILYAVGILRPLRNTFALDGLEQSKFYQVYLVSAVVIVFAPVFNHLADRVQWRVLIPACAAFFSLNLIVFWFVYTPGSKLLGMVFYGWYDLLAAALVTQFFMAVQIFFNARDAKSAIPLVIASGSLGATMGSLTNGFLSERLGAPNLMLLAAASIGVFAAALPFVWAGYPPVETPGRRPHKEFSLSSSEVVRVFSNRQIQLITALVLLTVVVKTVVDYEFNEAVAAYAGDRDAISSFQGYVYGAINWLPIIILLPLGPLLKRWGVGLAILMLPVVMFLGTVSLALFFSVWVAAVVKGADATFRYSAERTGREILYVPVPTELKLKAKAYVDMAIEKGVGKGAAAVLIFVTLLFLDYRNVTWVAVGLSVAWIALALAARRQYGEALAESIRGRFASLQASFASLTERSTLAFVEEALRGDPVQAAFGLDLVEQAGRVDAEPLADEMELLLDHESRDIRTRVLLLLARFPGLVPEELIRARLSDPSRHVREAAVVALAAAHDEGPEREQVLRELLHADEAPVRHATLTVLVREEVECDQRALIGLDYVEELLDELDVGEGVTVLAQGEPRTREELALALGMLESADPRTLDLLGRLVEDPEPRVARAALLSAGTCRADELHPRMLAALADPARREEAREALAEHGVEVVDLLEAWLTDPARDLSVRRQIPGVMARIPAQSTVSALLRALRETGSDRVVGFRTLKALNKLRTRNGDALEFEKVAVLPVARREVEKAERYGVVGASLERVGASGPGMELLRRAVYEAWEECQEAVFRCLGLVFPPHETYRAYVTCTRGDERARANAVEWLDQTVGHALFTRIEPVLRSADEPGERVEGGLPTLNAALNELASGPDAWLSLLAVWNLNKRRAPDPGHGREENMDLIEKVFLLQKVDLLEEAKSSHLALLASIAEEVDVDEGEVLIEQGQTNESLYVVVRGSVELRGMGDQVLLAQENTPFGTWALIDSDPSMVGARATELSRLLRITRSDFHDLLADHPELAMGMLQGLARRVRSLVA